MKLSPHFSTSEMECRCGCGFGSSPDDVSLALLDLLEAIRAEVGEPLHIASGCRCRDHNAAVGGVAHSSHTKGCAADIAIRSARDRYRLTRAAINAGCERIGWARGFVHVDVDPVLPRERGWLYR